MNYGDSSKDTLVAKRLNYYIFMFPSLTALKIRAVRNHYGWSQAEGAIMVSVTTRAWQWCKSVNRIMPGGQREFF
jgi:hypothetical protein